MFRHAFALALLPMLAWAQTAQLGPTLSGVRARDLLICGTSTGAAGFSMPDSRGEYRGIDNDICRAFAAAVLGDAAKIRWVPLTTNTRLTALQSGQIDVLARTVTWTHVRDTANGLNFTAISFYDGQGFMLRRSAGITRAADLAGATICVVAGSTNELNLADWARSGNIPYLPVVFEQNDEARRSYLAGRCDAYSTDASQLATIATIMHDPENQLVLSDIISKEPLGPAVRQGDDQWYAIVKWTLNALIDAEEQGITQANVDQKRTSESPPVRRLLGLQSDLGKFLALDNRWAYWAIKAVGNYGEMFARNFGPANGLNMPRGKNQLWSQGGLMYAAPVR